MESIEQWQKDKITLFYHPDKRNEIIKTRINKEYEHYRLGIINKIIRILFFPKHKLARLYTVLLILVFILYNTFIITKNYYIYSQKEISKINTENSYLKKNINAIGGLGLDIKELDKYNNEEITNVYFKKHGLINYGWKYKEIGYPVDPKSSYITSEVGERCINNNYEISKSIDIRQVYSLEIVSPIEGFCKVGQSKIYGNNIIIENEIYMINEIGEKELYKVKIRLSHLSKILISDNQWIRKGDIIAYMGNSGRCAIFDSQLGYWREITENERELGYGVHLDLEVNINGYLRNPVINSTFNKIIRL